MVRRNRPAGLLWLTALVALLLLAAPVAVRADSSSRDGGTEQRKPKVKDLPPHWRFWIEEEIYPLISKQQKRAFLQLETEAQRRAFVDRLWILWGRQTGFGSAFRTIYDERLAMARLEFGSTIDPRSRVLMIHGPPPLRMVVNCTEVFNPLEIWGWPYIEGIGEGPVVVFYQKGGLGRWDMWEGYGGWSVLYAMMGVINPGVQSHRPTGRIDSPENRCMDGDTIVRLLYSAERWTKDPLFIAKMYEFRAFETSEAAESAPHRFMAFSALRDKDAIPIDVVLDNESRGMRGGLVQVGFGINVKAEGLGSSPVGDVDVVQLDLIGEISRDLAMVDRFRYLYSVPVKEGTIGLDLERWVRPGDYVLRLKVEDVHSAHETIVDHEFSAEVVEATVGEDDDPDLAEIMLGIENDDGGERPILTLFGPPGDAIAGVRRFEAVTLPEVRKVTFLLDEKKVLTKNRPPFDIALDLGPLPRLTRVTAIAFDTDGVEIAREGLTLNVGRERFFLRIKPLSPEDVEGNRIRVGVELNVPSDVELEQMKLFWNDTELATMSEPPFESWVEIDRGAQFGLLRAVVELDDGSVAEDIQFVNAPEFGSVVDVTAVELPVIVLDRQGRPVQGLSAEDFTVKEDGVEQTISHVSEHRDLPVRVGIVIDTSGSMATTLPTVQRVVMGFLRNLLRPRDRAFIEIFSDRPELLASFTADFTTLENALLALYPDRATALYDSIIMGLFQFSGVRGRRAMILLTDGDDTASKNDFEDAIKYAQRTGVTIYAVGVDLPTTKVMTRYHLRRLSGVTGGHAFFVGRDSKLDGIYAAIDRELRSQYLLAYTSTSEKPNDEYRKIDVRVRADKKVRIRTISGYYPGGAE